VLLLIQGFMPTTAWAGCNHLVIAQSDLSLNRGQLDALIAGNLMKSLPEQPAPERRKPCSGLTCSSRDPASTSTISLEPEGSDLWGTLRAMVTLKATSPPGRIHEQPAPLLAMEKTSVFHPPRG
jgi:hypothetical protein